MLLVSTTRIIPGRAVPSFLSGRYPAVKVRKKLYVTAGLYAAGDVVGSVENRDGAMYRIGLTQAIAFGLIAGDTMSQEI